jgi:hypothetical protein
MGEQREEPKWEWPSKLSSSKRELIREHWESLRGSGVSSKAQVTTNKGIVEGALEGVA